MKYCRLLVCLLGVALTQGCTVLGFASDLALSSTIEDVNEGKRKDAPFYIEPMYFTNKGLEQDIKIVSGLLKGMVKAKQTDTVVVEQEIRLFPANYANKELCKQTNSDVGECHGPDYYQGFYILHP